MPLNKGYDEDPWIEIRREPALDPTFLRKQNLHRSYSTMSNTPLKRDVLSELLDEDERIKRLLPPRPRPRSHDSRALVRRRTEEIYAWPSMPCYRSSEHDQRPGPQVTDVGSTWLASYFHRESLRSFQARTGSLVTCPRRTVSAGTELGHGQGPFPPFNKTQAALTALIHHHHEQNTSSGRPDADSNLIRSWLIAARTVGRKVMCPSTGERPKRPELVEQSRYSIPFPVLCYLSRSRTHADDRRIRDAAAVVGEWFDLDLTGYDTTQRQEGQERREARHRAAEKHDASQRVWRSHWTP